MEKLLLEIKARIIQFLMSKEDELDKPYLTKGRKAYSKRELAKAVEDETEEGNDVIKDVLLLSLDLLSKKDGK